MLDTEIEFALNEITENILDDDDLLLEGGGNACVLPYHTLFYDKPRGNLCAGADDGEGARAKKVVAGGSTTYDVGEHYEVKDGAAVKYIFAGNRRIAKVTATDRYFCHKDHPGSSTVMTDKEAVEIESSDCLPFGQQREHTGTSVTDYKFTDQEYTNFT